MLQENKILVLNPRTEGFCQPIWEKTVSKPSPFLVTTEPIQPLASNIVCEFYLKGFCFLIVTLVEHAAENLPSTATSNIADNIAEFEIEGEHYAIVRTQSHPAIDPDLALLTERESQIATLVALGRSNKQIAVQLHISEWTVSSHLRRIFIKLGVESRAAMVYRCASFIQQIHHREGLS